MIITRFHDLEEIKLDVEFLTPCFLGGADQNAELRSAPFKAALRQWWRILYGCEYLTPEKLKTAEDSIFGSTEISAQVRISVKGNISTSQSGFSNGKKIQVTSKGRSFPINIIDYLAYGKYDYIKGQGNKYHKTHIIAGSKFQLLICYHNRLKKEISSTINAFLMYGSVGSRCRNGFGSLQATELVNSSYSIPFNSINKKSYPILSKESRLYITTHGYTRWEDALSDLGTYYREARTSLENRHQFKRRGFIARPIEVKNEYNIPKNVREGRHPKQFYMSLKKMADGKFFGQILVLPILFYEETSINQYNQAIQDMCKYLSTKMEDKTSEIRSYLGVKQ